MSFAHPHAAAYARLLAAMPDLEVRASDPDHGLRPPGESGGPALAAELGVAYAESYAELLDWRPDGVVVCAENARHRQLTEIAAAAGAQVLCEKPIATSLEDARSMIESCAAAGVHLMIAYPVRFSPAFLGLVRSVARGEIGTRLAVGGANNGRLPSGRAWFVDPDLAGGGALVDHVVHVADLVDVLLDGAPPRSVYAVTNRMLHAGRAPVETGGLVSVEYRGGVTATVDCSWSQPTSHPTWGGLTLRVTGTSGIAEFDGFAGRVGGHSERTRNGIWLPYGPDLDGALLADFVAAIREGRRPQPDGEAGLRGLSIVLAAAESARTGRTITLRQS